MKVIYLTAGHGNFANGKNYTNPAHGKFYHFTENGKVVFSAYEGETNRIIAKKFEEAMKGIGIEIVKVYHDNEDVPHITQVQRANAHFMRHKPAKALWFSNHSNAVGMNSTGVSQAPRGYSVWTSRGQTDSDKAASMLYLEVAEVAKKFGLPMLASTWQDGDSDYEADFDELYFTFMPAVLNELGFFTNLVDAKLLKNIDFQDAIVQAYKKAVLKWFDL
jgi:N-acetylmuramoyl-L-alanine amidase